MERELYKKIGQRIKSARDKVGLSQEEVATLMGYKSAATVSHFESGFRKISIVDLQKLSNILGTQLENLISESSTSEKLQTYKLRATMVRPNARTSIAEFLSFANAHAGTPQKIPNELIDVGHPGNTAEKVLEIVGVSEPPISPREVANKLNIPVFDWNFPDDVSGIFASNDSGVCIGVNQNHPYVRQRFSVAHEIGHYIFHNSIDNLFVDFFQIEDYVILDEESRKQEVTANQFAADLLMPKNWIKRDFTGLDKFTFLAQQYAVSEQALWYRLLSLKLVSSPL